MKKLILFLIICIMFFLMMSCVGENSEDNTTESTIEDLYASLEFIDENGEVIAPFSYAMDLENIIYDGAILGNRSNFKNTTETEVNTKEKAIELAKNELIWEYGSIGANYDKSRSMWMVSSYVTCFDYYFHQYVYIDKWGRTRLIKRNFYSFNDDLFRSYTNTMAIELNDGIKRNLITSGFQLSNDDDIVLLSFDRYIEALEFIGGIRKSPNKFKNIAATEIKTKEDVIELAKNELIEGKKYDRISVSYDESKSMWGVVFWAEEEPYGSQYIFMDKTGITKTILITHYKISDYAMYSEFLEKRGGVMRNPNEFINTVKMEIDLDNHRESVIKLAKNELTEGYKYDEIAVYWDIYNFKYVISFFADDTGRKGQHIFMDMNGITELIIYCE